MSAIKSIAKSKINQFLFFIAIAATIPFASVGPAAAAVNSTAADGTESINSTLVAQSSRRHGRNTQVPVWRQNRCEMERTIVYHPIRIGGREVMRLPTEGTRRRCRTR